MKDPWHYLVTEPFTWIFYYLFQPMKFKKELDTDGFLGFRLTSLVRLLLPIFVISYFLALFLRLALIKSGAESPELIANTSNFLLNTALGTLLGIVSGGALGSIGGVRGIVSLGIVGGITADIPFGFAGGLTRLASSNIVVFLVLAGEGLVAGTLIAGFHRVNKSGKARISFDINNGLKIGLRTFTGVSIALILALWIVTKQVGIITTSDIFKIILEDVLAGLLLGLSVNVRSGIILGVVLCTGRFITRDFQVGIDSGVTFIISFFLGYYRVPLYPFSAFSVFNAYWTSRKNPQEVFTYLDRSALYWDECVYIPLFRLKRLLLIAYNQNKDEAHAEFTFILNQRPQQSKAVWNTVFTIYLSDLETCDNLRSIAKVYERLYDLLAREKGFIDPQLAIPFTHLLDASRNAGSYYRTAGKEARRVSLENMTWNLKNAASRAISIDNLYSERLEEVVEKWLGIAYAEQEKLKQSAEEIGHIDSPYKVGIVLKPNQGLFVGRTDLIQKLRGAMSQGESRPTFFLTGERRMGKSSMLWHLSNLVGARYLTAIYDLQAPGILSSLPAFLAAVADGIYKTMLEKELRVKKSTLRQMQQTERQHNQAGVYHVFDEWLHGVERLLEQEDRMLILAFDEFENLEEVEQKQTFDLVSLLRWFRNLMQHHSRIALIFSGLQTIDELDKDWASYLVNAQVLKISFLRPAEAHALITEPVPDFAGHEIFEETVVEEIMRETNCHPFLTQALCSDLIFHLNAERRNHATLQDVEAATYLVLEHWPNYFYDQWSRCDEHQRRCLFALQALGQADTLTLRQKSGLHEQALSHTLRILLKRDLVIKQDEQYRIATPIFCKFLQGLVQP